MCEMCDQIRERLHAEAEAPVVVEAVDPEPIAEADVEIARIEADRDVQTAKIYAKGADEDTAALMAAMQARIDVLEAAATPPEPEPVVVVAEPEPEPEPEPDVAPPPVAEEPKIEKKKKSQGWFG